MRSFCHLLIVHCQQENKIQINQLSRNLTHTIEQFVKMLEHILEYARKINMETEEQTPIELKQEKANSRWQSKLRPWMQIVVTASVLVFLLLSTWQIYELQQRIDDTPKIDLGDPSNIAQSVEFKKWYISANLERFSIQQRYHQANILVMARIWTKYLGFITGMILAVIGASFILGKIKESSSQFTSKLESLEFSLLSSSPGLIMVVLGTILMLTSILAQSPIETRDKPLYLYPEVIVRTAASGKVAGAQNAIIDFRFLDEINKKDVPDSSKTN
jgi:hypothetical protein